MKIRSTMQSPGISPVSGLTAEQAAHLESVKKHFAEACANLPMPESGWIRDVVALAAAAWLRVARLKNPAITKPEAILELQDLIERKYIAGAAYYGGNIWEKDGMLEELTEELADAVCYADTAAYQAYARGKRDDVQV